MTERMKNQGALGGEAYEVRSDKGSERNKGYTDGITGQRSPNDRCRMNCLGFAAPAAGPSPAAASLGLGCLVTGSHGRESCFIESVRGDEPEG